jgi:hypothetical protein
MSDPNIAAGFTTGAVTTANAAAYILTTAGTRDEQIIAAAMACAKIADSHGVSVPNAMSAVSAMMSALRIAREIEAKKVAVVTP